MKIIVGNNIIEVDRIDIGDFRDKYDWEMDGKIRHQHAVLNLKLKDERVVFSYYGEQAEQIWDRLKSLYGNPEVASKKD